MSFASLVLLATHNTEKIRNYVELENDEKANFHVQCWDNARGVTRDTSDTGEYNKKGKLEEKISGSKSKVKMKKEKSRDKVREASRVRMSDKKKAEKGKEVKRAKVEERDKDKKDSGQKVRDKAKLEKKGTIDEKKVGTQKRKPIKMSKGKLM